MRLIFVLLFILPVFSYADTISINCDYSTYSNEKGNHKVKDKFVLSFVVDTETGKSYLIGNNGSAEVSFFKNDGSYTFVEMTGTGNITVTTLDKNLMSVHSRNMVLSGSLIPSQYYGLCDVK
ncbi:hypothetical protein [Colwellia sp. TT2012]|uniref:hypothetical protein n=1 Tax=Colwellia sp. TT2012 TaxID=1720342 RepID=UPI000709DE5B|nr:hypothetical protein [Colwellia sp. TT2012]